jgi:hypothetical protein
VSSASEILQFNESAIGLATAAGQPPAKTSNAKLFPRVGTVPLAIAGILALATAIECHAVPPGSSSVASWTLSLAYGAVLWLWWVAVVELLWRAGKRWPSTLRISPATAGVQLVVAAVIALLHLAILQSATHWGRSNRP